jgi:hypothetical protein
MGIKTRKYKVRNRRYIGGSESSESSETPANDVDWGYTGDFKGQNCHKLDKTKRVECAKKKYFSHCGKPKGRNFCPKPPKGQDKMRQDFYRKIVIESCEKDRYACSQTDSSGDPKDTDPMCTYINVCDDGMPISQIVPTATHTYTEIKTIIEGVFGNWDEMLQGNSRKRQFKKKKVRELKSKMKQIENDYNGQYSGKSSQGEDESGEENESGGEDEFGEQSGGEDEFGEDDNDSDESQSQSDNEESPSEMGTSKDKFKADTLNNCNKNINTFKKALSQYHSYKREQDALENVGTSLARNKKTEVKAAEIIKGKIEGFKECLEPLSAGSFNGLKIFEEYLKLDEKLAKLKNSKSIKRLGKMIGNVRSKYSAVKAQRQGAIERMTRKASKLTGTKSSSQSLENISNEDISSEMDKSFAGRMGKKILKTRFGKNMAKKMAGKFGAPDGASDIIDNF